MFLWWGLNTRILLGPAVGLVSVKDSYDSTQTGCLNGASHNYAGSYLLSERAEALHKLCLDALPVTLDSGVLLDAVHQELARFWSANFAITTSTGYGANYLAMPALLAMLRDKGSRVAVFCDEHCHNSIFTGVYLGMGRLGGITLGRFAHNDVAVLEKMLNDTTPDTIKLVVVEGLYSMEGDVPPLSALASLKQKHGLILYCDEAHSFLSLGKTGRGCLEHATDAGVVLPPDLIEIRTGTLSKAVGGIGGYIAGNAALVPYLSSHQQQVSTATLVQALWVIRQPLLARRNLSRLSAAATFCRNELGRLGVYTYGNSNTPVIPIWTGRSSVSAKFSYELRRRGVLASPITTPAVPFWKSRVRVNLSADFSAKDLDRLVCAIAATAKHTGVLSRGKFPTPAMLGISSGKAPDELTGTLEDEARAAFESISTLILETSRAMTHSRPEGMTAAGHAARQMYGMASGGSRWISGTFPPHIAAEEVIAARAGTEAAMTFQDPGISLASTIAALARPYSGGKRHVMLFPAQPGSSYVEDGLALVPPALSKELLRVLRYADMEDIVRRVSEVGVERDCVTVYVELSDSNLSQIRDTLCSVARCIGRKTPLTILFNDTRCVPDMVQIPQLMPAGSNIHAAIFSVYAVSDMRLAYLAGAENLIRELRYTSRGYMYTTSVPPFAMAMVSAEC
ncbi:hypothetical protein RB595_002082 [Gaeumannomyces hyphopodioides]